MRNSACLFIGARKHVFSQLWRKVWRNDLFVVGRTQRRSPYFQIRIWNNTFSEKWLKDKSGFQACAELVEYAIEQGINYFDVAPTYSNGYAESILGEVFANTRKQIYIAAKSGLMIDRTADDIRRRIDVSLKILHTERLDFYHIWSVMNMREYQEILKPGGFMKRSEGQRMTVKFLIFAYRCIAENPKCFKL